MIAAIDFVATKIDWPFFGVWDWNDLCNCLASSLCDWHFVAPIAWKRSELVSLVVLGTVKAVNVVFVSSDSGFTMCAH